MFAVFLIGFSIEHHELSFDQKEFFIIQILRYPPASDPSLKGWNAADELLIKTCLDYGHDLNACIILHDLFGYLSCHLDEQQPQAVITFASQQYAISKNLESNDLHQVQMIKLMEGWMKAKTALMRIPKSLDLFKLYLSRLSNHLEKDGTVLCGFMTRNFTTSWLKLAESYFSEVSQSRANKKARLLILKGPKPSDEKTVQEFIDQSGKTWEQYLGVFSAGRIDLASQFLMSHLEVPSGKLVAVDVGSGNGVLAKFVQSQNPEAELYLTDDNLLAVLSGELNVKGEKVHHHFSRNLAFLSDHSCDLVITNPPFHFEYELNLDAAFQIFKEAHRVLKEGGRLWIVANNNLPYKPQLLKHFKKCDVVNQNRKFITYCCVK